MTFTQYTATAIKAELEQRHMSRSALATKSAIPYTTLNRKLNGGADFTFTELARIAGALGVEPFTLLADEFTGRSKAAA